MQNYAYLLRLSIKSLLPWKIGARLFRKEGITRICCRNSQFTNMGKYATISKEAETWISAEYKQTQRTREYICWPHYREFPGGNFRFPWLRGKCRCRWKMAWERCSRDEYWCQWEGSWHTESNFLKEIKFGAIQTATGPPVIAEGYQDNGGPTITAVVGLSVWNRTQQGFWPRGRNEQKW